MVALNNETCELYAGGLIDPGGDLGQGTFSSQGSALHNPAGGTTELNSHASMW
jgi:hypothetical protein